MPRDSRLLCWNGHRDVGYAQSPSQTDTPSVLMITFAGNACGREMPALWDSDEIRQMRQKRRGLCRSLA